MKSRRRRRAASLAAVILTLTASTPAFAQGCAMCYNTAAAASAGAIQALRSGILILTFPPALIFITIFVLILHRRNRFDEESFDEFAVSDGSSRAFDSPEPASLEDGILSAADFRVSNFEFREPVEDAELAASTENTWK
ncbi:MAG TPA: hypothetical protein VGW33_04720 [Terriglobia bacterium]|nr:hypothetical protein [Terriglobia bacterium]